MRMTSFFYRCFIADFIYVFCEVYSISYINKISKCTATQPWNTFKMEVQTISTEWESFIFQRWTFFYTSNIYIFDWSKYYKHPLVLKKTGFTVCLVSMAQAVLNQATQFTNLNLCSLPWRCPLNKVMATLIQMSYFKSGSFMFTNIPRWKKKSIPFVQFKNCSCNPINQRFANLSPSPLRWM